MENEDIFCKVKTQFKCYYHDVYSVMFLNVSTCSCFLAVTYPNDIQSSALTNMIRPIIQCDYKEKLSEFSEFPFVEKSPQKTSFR
jgi:hypothetical protein